MGNDGVGEEHGRVVGAVCTAFGLAFPQKAIIDGADKLDRDIAEVITPEPLLA
ncbi:hypothetical protein X772_34650 [Mesorhizobium sp. LSJC280B00]|nr:hypothetical protein X772_34650 [Mesorhizobium sp. LSJC280B00]